MVSNTPRRQRQPSPWQCSCPPGIRWELPHNPSSGGRMNHNLVYHGEVTPQGIRNLECLITQAIQHSATGVTVCICSSGGDVTSGVGAYNFMRMQPVPVRTYAFGVCSSVAATMFMAGIDRISAVVNSFSLHAASYSEGPNIGQITDSTSLICAPFRTVSEWDESLISRHFGSTASTYLTAEDALRLRIATHIQDISFHRSEPVAHVAIPDQKPPQGYTPPAPKTLSELMNSCALPGAAAIPASR
ncbi:ATP-dependent Clp protease proteolytic subunit [Delftia tsuruhatensis]|nr:ATP-dependent Clp protease proteolytic subunit [Delftia tsuruhatensis]CAC9685430.1 ATP-dependent Clp protease proteolytic subunit [Delftia tsuruhatensis]